jgi:hypothetical protein
MQALEFSLDNMDVKGLLQLTSFHVLHMCLALSVPVPFVSSSLRVVLFCFPFHSRL